MPSKSRCAVCHTVNGAENLQPLPSALAEIGVRGFFAHPSCVIRERRRLKALAIRRCTSVSMLLAEQHHHKGARQCISILI